MHKEFYQEWAYCPKIRVSVRGAWRVAIWRIGMAYVQLGGLFGSIAFLPNFKIEYGLLFCSLGRMVHIARIAGLVDGICVVWYLSGLGLDGETMRSWWVRSFRAQPMTEGVVQQYWWNKGTQVICLGSRYEVWVQWLDVRTSRPARSSYGTRKYSERNVT